MENIKSIWITVFAEGESEGIGSSGEGAGAVGGESTSGSSSSGEKTFTQEQLNTFLADEKRKSQSKITKMTDELKALQAKSNLTAEERHGLESKIEELNNLNMTAEELAKKNKVKDDKTHGLAIEELTVDRDGWRERFRKSTVDRGIIDAAGENKAFRPTQILAILGPMTRLSEVNDDDGKPTGEFKTTVSFPDKNDKKEDIILELSPDAAVKRMKEISDYANLFTVEGTGGVGGTGSRLSGEGVKVAELAKDAKAYREARKSGDLTLESDRV